MPPFNKIGKYELINELGRGGMGVVFRARDPLMAREVAIKMIHTAGFGSNERTAELRTRLIQEARAAGNLSHPGIVTVYDLGEGEDFIYIVMELVHGESLDCYLARNGPYAQDAVSILAQVAAALDFAHLNGVIHRDVKPENILLAAGGRAKIADFGIAKIKDQHVTATGITIGTPAYMSPEQGRGDALDGRSDQFSLAVVAYELLTGRKPFDAPSLPAIIMKTATEEPPPPHIVNARLTHNASAVILRALAKRREQRYGTCREFVTALYSALVESPRPLRTPTVVEAPALPVEQPAIRRAGPAIAVPPQPVADRAVSGETTEASPGIKPRRRSLFFILGALIAVSIAVVAVKSFDRDPSEPTPLPIVNITPGPTRINPKDGLTYVWIPAGSFIMGCSPGDRDCQPEEKPAHKVELTKGFWIGKTSVTQAAYEKVTGTNPSGFNGASLPVGQLDWNHAKAYCDAVGMRLPTEAEWEYAARGGQPGKLYGNLDAIAWYAGNSGQRTHEVATRQPNGFGLYDMLGNSLQWVSDWHNDGYYHWTPAVDPQGPAAGAVHELRGIAYTDPADWARVSVRHGARGYALEAAGVRCAGN